MKKISGPPLAETHPMVAREALGWNPSDYQATSHSMRLWRCSIGHEYESSIFARTQKNNGCPYCSGHRVLAGFNDLATTHPELTRSIIEGDPTKFKAGSDTKFKWVCDEGHQWIASIGNRALRGTGCPDCHKAKKWTYTGTSTLMNVAPHLANEAHGWDPNVIAAGSEKKLQWKCSKGHLYEMSPASRVKKRHNCPICSSRRIVSGVNDLATHEPVIASQMIDGDPTIISRTSHKSFTWGCEKGHTWRASVANRVNRKSGCPFCANKKVLVGFNDMCTTHPNIAIEAFGWNPSTVIAGSHKKFKWKCPSGHVYEASAESRSQGLACLVCSNHTIIKGVNDLATTHPHVASEAVEWDPSSVIAGSNSKKMWKCSRGHVWEAAIVARTSKTRGKGIFSKGTGCPTCAGKKTEHGFNDLFTTHPNLAAQANGWDPRSLTAGSNKIVEWKCSFKHTWLSSVNNRAKQDLGCPICSGQKVLAGFNDLTTTHPEIASQAFGWDPTTLTRGANTKRKFRCEQGHVWEANISNRTIRGDGCPSCATTGFDPNLEGYFYFLKHDLWELHQIGITNYPKDRMKKHGNLGWEIIEVRGPMEGHLVRAWETDILRHLRKSGVKLAPVEVAGKFDGYSECWRISEYSPKSISEIFETVRDSDFTID